MYLSCDKNITFGISSPFELLSPTLRQIAYALLTRLPLVPKYPFDLHVLSTPPAFVLSQDQTLQKISSSIYSKKQISLIKRPALAKTLFSFQGVLSESACIGYYFFPILSTPLSKIFFRLVGLSNICYKKVYRISTGDSNPNEFVAFDRKKC